MTRQEPWLREPTFSMASALISKSTKPKYSLDTLAIREVFPLLDSLDDVIAAWRLAGYEQRSALQVMSNMDRRKWTEEWNYFATP